MWLQSSNAQEGSLYKDSFEKRWPSYIYPNTHVHLETYELLKKLDRISLRVVENLSASTASKIFEKEIREVVSSKVFRIMISTNCSLSKKMELRTINLYGNHLFDVCM